MRARTANISTAAILSLALAGALSLAYMSVPGTSLNGRDATEVDVEKVAAQLSYKLASGGSEQELTQELGLSPVKLSITQPAITLTSVVRSGGLERPADRMNTQPPRVYWDSRHHNHYLVADWGWLRDGWRKDLPRFRPYGAYNNIGGEDAFGINVSRPIVNLNAHMTVCGGYFGYGSYKPENSRQRVQSGLELRDVVGCHTTRSYILNSDKGVAIAFQDKARVNLLGPGITNADRGSLVLPLKFPDGGCYQFTSAYMHTWSSTKITGVGVGKEELSFQWESKDHGWKDVSDMSSAHC